MAGFSSRLREKIESTRSHAVAGNVASNHQPKNIRGLTRLGASGAPSTSPSGGLLRGRGSSLGTPGLGGGGAVGNSIPLPVQTSSLKKENGPSVRPVHPQNPPGSVASSGVSVSAFGLDNNATSLGGSKIVPGWGSCRNDTSNAPSGHLGGIKSRDLPESSELKQRQWEDSGLQSQHSPPLGKHVPWALHQPLSRGTFSQLSVSRRRWGDEEDEDSDDDFPQIGELPHTSALSGNRDNIDEVNGSNSCKQRDEKASREKSDSVEVRPVGSDVNLSSQHPHKRFDGHRYRVDSKVEYPHSENKFWHHSNQGHRDNVHGNCRYRGNGFRPGQLERGSYCYIDDERWKNRRAFRDRRYASGDARDSRWSVTHMSPIGDISKSLVDHYDSNKFQQGNILCRGQRQHDSDSRCEHRITGGNGCLSQETQADIPRRKEDSLDGPAVSVGVDRHLKQQHSQNSDHILNKGRTNSHRTDSSSPPSHQLQLRQKSLAYEPNPMVLLRNDESDNKTAKARGEFHDVAARTDEAVEGSCTACQLDLLDESSSPVNPSQPPSMKSSASASSGHLLPLSTPHAVEKKEDQVSSSSVTDEGQGSFPASKPQISPVHCVDDGEQDRKDRAIAQQQNVLRQVAERRAAAVASSQGNLTSERVEVVKWERGRKLPTVERNGKGSGVKGEGLDRSCEKEGKDKLKAANKVVEKSSVRRSSCRKEGHFHDWKDSPSKLKAQAHSSAKLKTEKPNPCRIEGHSHDWNDCPKNPKSESFVRNNPCRIEGHNHDWNDCLDNPKSDNYVKPSKKGRRVPKSLSRHMSVGGKAQGSEQPDDGKDSNGSIIIANKRPGRPLLRKVVGKTEVKEEKSCDANTDLTKSSDIISENKSVNTQRFVPAPLPTVSAWMSGPPSALTSVVSASTPLNCASAGTDSILHVGKSHEYEVQPLLNSAQKQLPGPEPAPLASFQNSSVACPNSSTQLITKTSILPLTGSLFPGNSAVFGESGSSTTVYGNWNPPPIVMPRTSVEPWKPNPFAQTSNISLSLSGVQFRSIWSDSAVSLVTASQETTMGTRSHKESRHSEVIVSFDHPSTIQDEIPKEIESLFDLRNIKGAGEVAQMNNKSHDSSTTPDIRSLCETGSTTRQVTSGAKMMCNEGAFISDDIMNLTRSSNFKAVDAMPVTDSNKSWRTSQTVSPGTPKLVPIRKDLSSTKPERRKGRSKARCGVRMHRPRKPDMLREL